MAEHIRVVPEELLQDARAHREFADQLDLASATHAAVLATLDSLGPVFAGLRDDCRAVLDQRRGCYQREAAVHAEIAGTLCHVAQVWEEQDGDAARRLGRIGEHW